ncbi:MAG TPA: DivIVA domain-containing protein [Solirubrobacteraceae bacterium]
MPDQSSAASEHAILQEITQPLEALPDDPLAYVDADFPSALRGYERFAVDEYVQQTRRLVAELQATRSPEAAVRRALERVGEQISGILQRAHETAEQITAQSRGEAEDRLQEARREATAIAGAAEQRVRDLDADTDRIWLERQRIVADAEDLAGQLLGLAKTASERFPADGEADAAGMSLPYDDAEPSEAEATSFAADGEDLDDEAPSAPPEPLHDPDRSEIERTVAFQPLEPRLPPPAADETDPPTDETEPATNETEPPTDVAGEPPKTRRFTDDESTHVIPPASQAANRRLSD